MAESPWETDVNRFCERLAERLRSEGLDHPEAAAVALTVRGFRSVSAEAFAADLDLPVEEVRAIEEGEVPVARLPASLVDAARAVDGLDWDRLTPD